MDDLDLKMSPVISETVGELMEKVGRECREGVELLQRVNV